MSIIKPKSGTGKPNNGQLSNGELAVDTSNNRIYIGDGSNVAQLIGSRPAGSTSGEIQYRDTNGFFSSSSNFLFDGTNLLVKNQGNLRLYSSSTTYIGLKASSTVGTSNIYTLPDAVGSVNQVLRIKTVNTNDAVLEWATVSANPGGSNTYIQYNSNSTFAGSAYNRIANGGSYSPQSLTIADDDGSATYIRSPRSGDNTGYCTRHPNQSPCAAPNYAESYSTGSIIWVLPSVPPAAGSLLTCDVVETFTGGEPSIHYLGWTNAFSNLTTDTLNDLTISVEGSSAFPATTELKIGINKAVTFNNTLTLNGVDSSTVNFGSGGTVVYQTNNTFQIVDDLTARNAIDSGNRKIGMLVYVTDQAKYYKLVNGITNSDWQQSLFLTIDELSNLHIEGNLIVSGYIETDTGIRGGTDAEQEYLGYGMALDGGTY